MKVKSQIQMIRFLNLIPVLQNGQIMQLYQPENIQLT